MQHASMSLLPAFITGNQVARSVQLRLVLAMAVGLICAPGLQAFPEYQAFVRQHSGRPVDCAMCHINAEGPLGSGPGQIGRLTDEELDRLNQSRAALQPGQAIENPTLNAFGNKILFTVGMKKFVALKENPAALAALLDQRSDLDGDSIPDVREYLSGTHPLSKTSGAPLALFVTNLRRNRAEVVIAVVAALLILLGLGNLLAGYEKSLPESAVEPESEPVMLPVIPVFEPDEPVKDYDDALGTVEHAGYAIRPH